METKKEIRRRIRQIRSQIPEELKKQYSVSIQNKLLQDKAFQDADEIFCYVNNKDEVKTDLIMSVAWKLGKKVAVPKVMERGIMEFFYISGREELAIGHYGILEPLSNSLAKGNQVLMIMPGVGFDRKGNRIGYGGGYYDRYLMRYSPKYKIALSYSDQITEYIRNEEQDVSVDKIFTEREIIKC